MDERRGETAGTQSVYDRHPAWRWVDAIAWLSDLMHQEIMGEPYEDVCGYLIANPCDEYWCIGHDFDMAVTTWVVGSVVRDRDGCRVACDYMDGFRPPAWSCCSRFLEEGLAKGDFHDIRAETDPDMHISLQRLVDDIPANLEDRWDEIPEGGLRGRWLRDIPPRRDALLARLARHSRRPRGCNTARGGETARASLEPWLEVRQSAPKAFGSVDSFLQDNAR